MRPRFATLLLVPAACVIAELDYTNKACPCPEGYQCVESRCARGAGSGDGGPDGASGDAAAGDTSSGDVGDATPAGPPFCDTVDAGLCVDFGRAGDLVSFSPSTSAGGTLDLATDEWTSPPSALVARVASVAAGDVGFAVVVRNFTGVTKRFAMAFDAKLVMTQVGALGRFATVSFDTDYAIGLVPSVGTIGLEETGPKDAAAPPNHASHALDWNGRFVHLELELARSTCSQFVATLKVDGVAVDAAVALAPNFALGKTATMVIGWGYVPGPSAPVAGFVDNLIVSLE